MTWHFRTKYLLREKWCGTQCFCLLLGGWLLVAPGCVSWPPSPSQTHIQLRIFFKKSNRTSNHVQSQHVVMSLNVLSLSFRVRGLSRLVLQVTRSPNTVSPTSKCLYLSHCSHTTTVLCLLMPILVQLGCQIYLDILCVSLCCVHFVFFWLVCLRVCRTVLDVPSMCAWWQELWRETSSSGPRQR